MSKKWSIAVKRTIVKGIFSKKDTVEVVGIPSQCMKLKLVYHSKLDDEVLIWLKQARGQNLPVGGDLIKQKAELLHISNFMASNGWLDNFKKHHGITFKTVQGKAGAVYLQSLLEWQQQAVLCSRRLQPG